MALPPGKKPLREVEQQSNAANRVIDLVILLDFALAEFEPAARGAPSSVSERIKRHADRFSSLRDLLFAVGVRNDLVHAPGAGRASPKEAEIKRAAKHLRNGLLEITPLLDREVARAILAGSHADPEREKRAPPAASRPAPKPGAKHDRTDGSDPEKRSPSARGWIIGAITLLALTTVPPLLKRWMYGSESAAEGSRTAARALAAELAVIPPQLAADPALKSARSALNSGDHWWARLDFNAAAERYDEAVRQLQQVRSRLDRFAVAERAKSAAEMARDQAIMNRAPAENAEPWKHALEELERANREFDAGSADFGAALFSRTEQSFTRCAEIAENTRTLRLAESRERAEAELRRGDVEDALERWFQGALEGDAAARARFDEVARSAPAYFEHVAVRRFESADGSLPDRLRASIALARRARSAPDSLIPSRLLALAFRDALRVPDPESAADFLIEIGRAQLDLATREDVARTLLAAADPVAVIRDPSNAVLRYAQLAALASRVSDALKQEEYLRLARQPTLTQSELSRLPKTIFLADLGSFEEALAEANSLMRRPEDRDYAQLAFSWIALRAAERGESAIHRRAVLSISSLAEKSGSTSLESLPIDGAQSRGAVTLLKLVEADLALGRMSDAERWRIAILFPPLRAAADYALAQALAKQHDLPHAQALFDEVDHARSTFGSAAAAEIAAEMIRVNPDQPSLAWEWARALPTPDLVLSAVGAIAQDVAVVH